MLCYILQIRQAVLVILDLTVIFYHNGVWPAVIHVAFCVISYLAALSSSVVICWTTSIGLLTMLNVEPFITYAVSEIINVISVTDLESKFIKHRLESFYITRLSD